jgi:hypothetical protein
LLERRYVAVRDEMLWREYGRCLAIGGHIGVKEANRVLRLIREAPE